MQTDVKSALIHATVFQVGLMFVAIGLGWMTLATVHLCLHAAWRTWHFPLAPSWLQITCDRPPPPRPGGSAAACCLHRGGAALLAGPVGDDSGGQSDWNPSAQDVGALETNFIDRAIGEVGKGSRNDETRPLVRS